MAKKLNPGHREGEVAKTIEKQTARLPSDVFLWTAVSFMAVSASLQIAGRRHVSLFVGQWVAPFLLFGIYNKLVKLQGHDKEDKGGADQDSSRMYGSTMSSHAMA